MNPIVWPRISVVVPAYNQAAYVRQCLASIFTQDYPNLEVIVMDAGSNDGTLAILEEYRSRCAYFQSGPDGGQVAALNKGLFEIATGEILTWLNTDDYWAPGILQEVARAIAPREERWLVAGRCRWVVEPGGQQHDHPFFGSRTHRQVVQFWKHGTIPQCSVFFHRSIMEQAGRLEPAEKLGFDYLCWLRLTALPGVQLYFVDRVWSYYRLQDQAKTVAAHYQSHCDLERLSRQFWPPVGTLSRLAWAVDYWWSIDPYKPQQQRFLKEVQPALRQAWAGRNYAQVLWRLAWVLAVCPRNLILALQHDAKRLPTYPVKSWFCLYKRFRHRLAQSVRAQQSPLLHGVSSSAFNLHPAPPGTAPTRLVVTDRRLFSQPRVAIQFQASVPDARAGAVVVSCWLEADNGSVVGRQQWTVSPSATVACAPVWSPDRHPCSRLVFEAQSAPGVTANHFQSTIIAHCRWRPA